jgi:CubicO group peptidase (beta-lactamase class C family)
MALHKKTSRRDPDPPDVLDPELRMDPRRWEHVLELAGGFTGRNEVPAVALCAGRGERSTGVTALGRHRLDGPEPGIREDTIFLVASLTKPIVAMGAMLLVERGQLFLGDRVQTILPEFRGDARNAVTVRNLLTHTSGLPDQLPNNTELRAAHAPLSKFIEETCGAKLAFPHGRGVQYQSMGFLLLGEIIRRVSGQPCPEFLRQEFFEPLGMQDTALGAPEEWYTGPAPKLERVAEIRVPDDQADGPATDWNWNSRYWQTLGAPWGGLLSTADDLSKFCRMMLDFGRYRGHHVLSRAVVEAATRNQLAFLRDVPEDDRRVRPWGFGWRLNWPAHSANFGDLTGPKTYGHWGATGTLMWIDPEHDTWAVVLTTQPQEPHGTYIARLSNAIAGSFL